jgi:pyridoxamine 5'-phosphate oxidase
MASDWPRSGQAAGADGPDPIDLARMRLDYETAGLEPGDLAPEPMEQFDRWMADAVAAELYEPNAMVISTVDADGQPWSRYVLLKGAGPTGFDFYTNYHSFKSQHLGANPRASATFGWLDLHRQVNVSGSVERVPTAESDAYWAVRVRGSQLGAWTSEQSSELADRSVLERRYQEFEARFGDQIPRPEHWGGWRLVPHTVEFWQGRQNRLHDRLRYRRQDSGEWTLTRLSP